MRYGDNKFVISSKNPLVERDNRKNTVSIVMACHFHTTRLPTFNVMTKGNKNSVFHLSFTFFTYIHQCCTVYKTAKQKHFGAFQPQAQT